MNKGCPSCGSKKLIGEEVTLMIRGRDGILHPGKRTSIYKCNVCGWQGEWSQLRGLKKGTPKTG
jgi:hypothetical protein